MGSRKGIGAELVELDADKDDSDKGSVNDVDLIQVTRAIALYCASLASTTSTSREVLFRAEEYTQYILTGKV